MLEQSYVIVCDSFKFTKEITKSWSDGCCDKFEQVNGGWLVSYLFNCMGELI